MACAGQLQLAGDLGDVRRARHWLGGWLLRHDVEPDVIDTTVLLLSEVVTNAAVHAQTGITVRVSLTEHCLRVEVTDERPDRGPARSRPAHDAEAGRGLGILEKLAVAWGADRRRGSKTVWFEMAC